MSRVLSLFAGLISTACVIAFWNKANAYGTVSGIDIAVYGVANYFAITYGIDILKYVNKMLMDSGL